MLITITPKEANDKGIWEDLCEMKGINVWAMNEGLIDSGERIELTEDEAEKLGLFARPNYFSTHGVRKRGTPRRKWFVGMQRSCQVCDKIITVTEQMCKRSNYRCSSCNSRIAYEYKKKNWGKAKLQIKAYLRSEKGKIFNFNKTKRFREKYPEKHAAHIAVQTAIRNGSLVRKSCEECGEQKSQAHHDDYSKPLDVRWLCQKCHANLHLRLKELDSTPSK